MDLSVILGILFPMMIDDYDFITRDLFELELVVVTVTDYETLYILGSVLSVSPLLFEQYLSFCGHTNVTALLNF